MEVPEEMQIDYQMKNNGNDGASNILPLIFGKTKLHFCSTKPITKPNY